MSKTIVNLALLGSALLLPAIAHADSIDNFVLTGGGNTITFSLPASPAGNQSTCPTGIITSCLPGSETAFYLSTLVTDDGVASMQSLAFPTFRFGGGMQLSSDRFFGDQLFTPDAANPTFVPGTYELDLMNAPGPGSPIYDLSITPAIQSTATPEPASATLLFTGILGIFGLAAVRRLSGPAAR